MSQGIERRIEVIVRLGYSNDVSFGKETRKRKCYQKILKRFIRWKWYKREDRYYLVKSIIR